MTVARGPLENLPNVDHDRPVARAPHTRQLPTFIQPMAARVVDKLPEGDDWMYEVKFNGYRALLLKNGDMSRFLQNAI